MARPRKQTVDYFPHYVNHGKTMFILENKFGNDGYAFWFKLLEILGATEGHVYSYKNPTDKEFLHAKTRVGGETAEKILNLLADLEAIDHDLWYQEKLIWSDHFVENLAEAYKKRVVDLPQKPKLRKKPYSQTVSDPETPDKEGFRRQESINEMKVNEMKVNDIHDVEDELLIGKAYEEFFHQVINTTHIQMLQSYINDGMDESVIIEAMKRSEGKERPFSYCKSILDTWVKRQVKNMADVEKLDREHEQKKHQKKVKKERPREDLKKDGYE